VLLVLLQKRILSADYLYAHGNPESVCELVPGKFIECINRSAFQRLLSIPLLPTGHTSAGTHVIAEVKLGIDSTYANTHDADFFVLFSDGHNGTGFTVVDRLQYGQPCHQIEGNPGSSLSNQQSFFNGPTVNNANPVPQVFEFFFSTKQKWGSCTTATAYEGSYTTSGHYTKDLHANNGLYLDFYSDDEYGEKHYFKYIILDIKWTTEDLCH